MITLTRKGQTELVRLDALVAAIQERFLALLSESERMQLTRILTKLTAQNDPSA